MRPNLLERRRWAPVTRRPRFRPIVEMLETRVVPSVVDYSAGFAGATNLTFNGTANISGTQVQLTNGNLGQAASFFTNSTFDITQFTTTFTFNQTKVAGNPTFADGLTFTIQASPSGPAALGANGEGLGYEGIPNSVAIKFDLYDNAGEGNNSTGIFTDGRDPTVRQAGLPSPFPDLSVSMDGSGVSLQSQDLMQVTLAYDGSTLTETVKDTVTGATFTQAYSVNIASMIGSNTAYLGFTGATGGLGTSVQNIQTWLGNFGPTVTPPLTASSVGTINGVEGQLLQNIPVATFTGPSSSAGTAAIINWGDGTASIGVITGPDQNGVFTVLGTHTYVEEGTPPHGGPFVITVTITSGTATASVTDNTNIFEAPIVATGGFTISGVEGQAFTATVATFTDTGGPENASLDYSATIDWGDGTTSTGTIAGPDQNGVFYVLGTHAYAEETNSIHGFPTITVTISHETASPVTVFDTVSIAEAPIVATGGFTISGVEGQTFSAAVATFTDTGGPQVASLDYSATIDWGDGTTSTGTIVGPDQNGVFYVIGSHAYAEETDQFHGFPTITVTITHESAPAVQVTDTTNIAEAPLSVTPGPTVIAAAGQDVTAAVATFVDTGGPENATLDYTASIDWGDGNTTTGLIVGPDQNGVFTVIGDHAYSADGTYTVSVAVFHEAAGEFDTSTTAVVVGPFGGGASLAGQGPTRPNLNLLQAPPVQQVSAVPVLIEHTPVSTPASTASNDLYWSQYASSGDSFNLNGLAANDLSLALQGSPSY